MTDELFDPDFIREHEIRAKKISDEILNLLDNFITEKKDLLQPSKSNNNSYYFVNVLFANKEIFAFLCLVIICIFYLFLFIEFKVSISIRIIWTGLTILPSFGFLVYSLWKNGKFVFTSFKEIRNKSVFRARRYTLVPYYQIIEELGETFHEEYLHREELRFKLAIGERRKISNRAKKTTPLLSILLVAVSIWILGFPNGNDEVSFLYGTVAGISGIVFVTKVLLDVFLELLDEDIDIYEKCVLILQKAQYIARVEQEDAIKVCAEAMALDDEIIPFEQAISEIEHNRK